MRSFFVIGLKICENLAKRFKFIGFSLELKGRWFTLYGIINPEVPLAKGKINLPKDSYEKIASNARANKVLKLMDEVTGGHIHGRHSATKADKWLIDRAFGRITYIQQKLLLSF